MLYKMSNPNIEYLLHEFLTSLKEFLSEMKCDIADYEAHESQLVKYLPTFQSITKIYEGRERENFASIVSMIAKIVSLGGQIDDLDKKIDKVLDQCSSQVKYQIIDLVKALNRIPF